MRARNKSSNRSKGLPLESATRTSLIELKVMFDDLTSFYNGEYYEWIPLGSRPKNGRVADFETSLFTIEDKNWNCINYYVDFSKVDDEIILRFVNSHPRKKKILIISNPRWIKGVKEMLISLGFIIIELGFFVTWNNFSRAVHVIKKNLRKLLPAGRVKDNKLDRVCNNSRNKSYNIFREIVKLRVVHPNKHIKQRYKRRKDLLFFRKFLKLIVYLLSVKSISLAKIGGVIMKKENEDVDYSLEYYCEQCCRYGYCKIIKEHERNRTRLYNKLEKSEYMQKTLFPIEQIREENKPNRFIQILNEFKGSLDKVLRCLKKRNYLHKRYLQAKTGYPCFS